MEEQRIKPDARMVSIILWSIAVFEHFSYPVFGKLLSLLGKFDPSDVDKVTLTRIHQVSVDSSFCKKAYQPVAAGAVLGSTASLDGVRAWLERLSMALTQGSAAQAHLLACLVGKVEPRNLNAAFCMKGSQMDWLAALLREDSRSQATNDNYQNISAVLKRLRVRSINHYRVGRAEDEKSLQLSLVLIAPYGMKRRVGASQKTAAVFGTT